jgi:hypothetical protein
MRGLLVARVGELRVIIHIVSQSPNSLVSSTVRLEPLESGQFAIVLEESEIEALGHPGTSDPLLLEVRSGLLTITRLLGSGLPKVKLDELMAQVEADYGNALKRLADR